MIEIKRTNGINFITLYKDLVAEGVDFTTLDTTPYMLLTAQGVNKCVVPVNIIIDYNSTGFTSEYYIYSDGSLNLGESMFKFWNQVVAPTASGILVLPNFLTVTSNDVPINNILNSPIFLGSGQPTSLSNFSRFRIYFTYYIQNLVP